MESLQLKQDKMKTLSKEQKENPLFSRKEVVLQVQAEVVPSIVESKKIVAKEFSSKEDVVRIRKISGKFGAHIFSIVADVYDSLEEFNRVVKKTKQEVDAEKKAIEEKEKAEAEAKLVKAQEEAAKKAEKEKPVAQESVPSNVEDEGKAEIKEKPVEDKK